MIERWLLEDVWQLAALAACAQCALIVRWAWARTRTSARTVWAGFAVGVGLIAMSILVVTPRERINAVCRDLAACVESADIRGIESHLALQFSAGELDRDAFLERLESTLTKTDVSSLRLRGFKISITEPGVGLAEFSSGCLVDVDGIPYGWMTLRWRLTFYLTKGRWQLRDVESIPVPPLDISDLESLVQ